MLGGLQRHVHPGQRAELAGPDPARVDDQLGLDVALLGGDGDDPPVLGSDAGRRDALDHAGAELPGAFGERGGDTDGIGAPFIGYIEGRKHVSGLGQRPEPGHLGR